MFQWAKRRKQRRVLPVERINEIMEQWDWQNAILRERMHDGNITRRTSSLPYPRWLLIEREYADFINRRYMDPW